MQGDSVYFADRDYETIFMVTSKAENKTLVRSNLAQVTQLKAYSDRHSDGKLVQSRQNFTPSTMQDSVVLVSSQFQCS